jgi:hypothetical protein
MVGLWWFMVGLSIFLACHALTLIDVGGKSLPRLAHLLAFFSLWPPWRKNICEWLASACTPDECALSSPMPDLTAILRIEKPTITSIGLMAHEVYGPWSLKACL